MKLIKDSIWSLLSIGIPALVAIPVFSLIAKQVGIEIFGIYTLSFAIIGYASIFDLGLSRAVIREVAINSGNRDDIVVIINTAFSAMVVLGIIAGVAVFCASELLVNFISVSSQYQADIIKGLKWLALCLPLLLISQIWLSYFEGLSEFKSLSMVRTLSNVLIVVLPYVMGLIKPSFDYLMIGMLIARFFTFLISYFWVKRYIALTLAVDRICLKRLLGFGGWLTVSSIIGPVMVYLDRFILSAMIGAKSVAFYTAPAELVVRMASIPSTATKTLFVRFSNQSNGQERHIYMLSVVLLLLGILVLVIPTFFFAPQVLELWLGKEFLGESVVVLRILLLGLIFNALAQVPYSALQAKGYSKLTAIIHSAEIIPYTVLLYVLIGSYEIIGVAIAWLVRMVVDTLLLFYFNKRLMA